MEASVCHRTFFWDTQYNKIRHFSAAKGTQSSNRISVTVLKYNSQQIISPREKQSIWHTNIRKTTNYVIN